MLEDERPDRADDQRAERDEDARPQLVEMLDEGGFLAVAKTPRQPHPPGSLICAVLR